jgi:hypothetical protein
MKYIFVTGAPGSKWSSVVKNIYYSPSINRSDYSDARTYYHDASGRNELMHLGAYWDPGMEFGDFFNNLESHTKEECEHEFDRPFSADSTGVRIIKSHVFAHQVATLRQRWPDCAIVLVHRSDDACLGWWVKCGHFDITYPSYAGYYQNLRHMADIIKQQNAGIRHAWTNYTGSKPQTNRLLAADLGIETPPLEYIQDYNMSDIKVKVI